MSTAEIIAQLPQLRPDELAEIQAKLDELSGACVDDGEVSEAEEAAIEEGLAAYENNPHAISSWEEARARIEAGLKK